MTIATENLIRALPLNTETVMNGELDLVRSALEKLLESHEARILREELLTEILRITQVSEQIQKANTLHQKAVIYYSEYRSLLDSFKAKYSEFLDANLFREIEICEKYMNGLTKLIISQFNVLKVFEKEIEKGEKCAELYREVVQLSEIVEEHLPCFSEQLIKYIEKIALSLLEEPSLKPDATSQDERVFSCLIGLKNTARSILWQIEEQRSGKSHSIADLEKNSEFARQIQVHKNQAAINWAKSQLDQMDSILKAKGYKV